MRSLMLLIDGLGDEPIPALGDMTPFSYANHPAMDRLAAQGVHGLVSICQEDIIPESCSCILRLLGVDKKDMPTNRAYLELLAHDRDITEYEMVLRCNLVLVDNKGRLIAFNGQGLSNKNMAVAAALCDAILPEIEFFHLSEYRNLLLLDKQQAVLDAYIPPPHESLGGNIQELLGEVRSRSLAISYLLDEAKKRLRVFTEGNVHYELYPWGPSARQLLPSFKELHHGMSGASVCKAEIVAGMCQALKMEVVTPQGATGDIDTSISAKTKATLRMLKNHDYVMCHFNGTDEASHRYDYNAKMDFISRIDNDFLSVLVEQYKEPLKILICGDHITSSISGKHSRGCVPVAAGIINDNKAAETLKQQLTINSYHDILRFLMEDE